MNFLEVKLDNIKQNELDSASFISEVIKNQETLGFNKMKLRFQEEKLLSWGFSYNSTTKGFYYCKQFTIEELEDLAKKVSSLENHILTHSYLVLKYYENKLYFWDTALIYEGVDTFEYCLEYHNLFSFEKVNILTKSKDLNEELLNLAELTRRYSEPALGFITQGCVWDKKEGMKILKALVPNINEYMSKKDVKEYKK